MHRGGFSVTSFPSSTTAHNYQNAKVQETQLIEQLNKLIADNNLCLQAVHVNDETKTGIRYSTLLDLTDGDIYIYATNNGVITGKPIMYIDVKVAFISKYKDNVSTITRRSFNNFANKENHYYWCFNENGRISVLIDALTFYKSVNAHNPWNISKKPGCFNDRNEDFIMGLWIYRYRNYFMAHI